MHARFLKTGEEQKWFDLIGEESHESFTKAAGYRPESHIIVVEGNRIVGGLILIIDEPDSVMLFNPKIKIDRAISPLLSKAIETALSLKVERIYSLIHESSDRFQIIDHTLRETEFTFGMKKILYQLKSLTFSNSDTPPLAYESLGQDTEACFIDIFKTTFQPDFFESDAERYFAGLRKDANKTRRFYAEDWEIGIHGDKHVGITMPQLHDEGGEIGSNFHLGVVPERRHKGFGRALQRRAIETLRKRGAKMIVGSTDVRNKAMIKVFESLGYEFSEYQYFYEYRGII
jgi:ribosomal protein S18 acetylase RimI-like enzyme